MDCQAPGLIVSRITSRHTTTIFRLMTELTAAIGRDSPLTLALVFTRVAIAGTEGVLQGFKRQSNESLISRQQFLPEPCKRCRDYTTGRTSQGSA
jgi:hypothetical protein